MGWIVAVLALLLAGVAAWVRLAPSDPARWHQPVSRGVPPDCTVRAGMGDAAVACVLPGDPAAVLARLDANAQATPRTTRLAGSTVEGRITWVTRSALWGFPDYTTASASPAALDAPDGTRLDIHARLRFGQSDLGVNAARLTDWLSRLRAD